MKKKISNIYYSLPCTQATPGQKCPKESHSCHRSPDRKSKHFQEKKSVRYVNTKFAGFTPCLKWASEKQLPIVVKKAFSFNTMGILV